MTIEDTFVLGDVAPPSWGNAVTAAINAATDALGGLEFIAGEPAFSGDAGGVHTFNYDATFDTAPIVLANVDISTTGDVTWFISERTTTDFTIRIRLNGALYTSGGNVQFLAIGALA